MKKSLLFTLALIASIALMAQDYTRPVVPKALKDYSLTKPMHQTHDLEAAPIKAANPSVKAGTAINEETIGETKYDLQSNSACQNRFWVYEDGTKAGTWTYAVQDAGGYPDRGTGYNYFDGTGWGPYPTARIESDRNGWPSYAPWGQNGEVVVSHLSGAADDGLFVSTRAAKGTGTWTENILEGPTGNPSLLWPRMTTGGVDNSTIHVMALTRPVANNGTLYNGMDGALLYYRSQDGGVTWDKQAVQPPGMTSTEYTGFSGDGYAFAAARGNTVAFVIGDNWYDLVLLKSIDNGDTWTKTTIFEHPYPMFDEATDLVLDTPTVADGAMAVAIDDNDDVHVAFGIMRVLNDDLTDGNTSYFPYTDGIAYWKEGMPAFDTLLVDSLDANGNLIGWWQDVNGNDTIDLLPGEDAIGLYFLAASSMPQLAIKGDTMFLVYSSLTEGKDNALQNYRHLWGRASFDGGVTWGNFAYLTESIIHNFDECVFPSVAPIVDDAGLHLIYQLDDEPGLSVRGDEDPATVNSIVYMNVTREEFGVGIDEVPQYIDFVSQNYPNPASGQTAVEVHLKHAATLSLEVTNIMGQKVMDMSQGKVNAGPHIFDINVSKLGSGVYFYTIHADEQAITKKMIVR